MQLVLEYGHAEHAKWLQYIPNIWVNHIKVPISYKIMEPPKHVSQPYWEYVNSGLQTMLCTIMAANQGKCGNQEKRCE